MALSTDRPASYADVFAVPEWRWLFGAQALSLVGDQLCRVALTVLVFTATGSAPLTGLVFALTLLPWLVGGPLLGVVADRFPRRTVMIGADLVRAVLVALVAAPGLPLPAVCLLIVAVTLLAAPFEAARAATMPEVLPGDRYVVGSAVSNVTQQVAQVLGYAGGGLVLLVLSPRQALLLDAGTFLVSAALLRAGVQDRRPPVQPARSAGGAFSDVRAGAAVVLGDPLLRALVLLAWAGAAFAVVPEGLVAPYAQDLHGGAGAVGLLLAAAPAGAVVGALLVGRLVAPARRLRLLIPLALLSVAPLLGFLARPGLPVSLLLLALSGVGGAFQLPANAAFVAAVPAGLRGRAFALVGTGLYAGQGLAVLLAGVLASVVAPALVMVGAGGLGLVCVARLAPSLRVLVAGQDPVGVPMPSAPLTGHPSG